MKIDKRFTTIAQGNKLVPHLDRCIGEGDFEWTFDYKPKEGDDAWHPSGDCTPSLNELYLKAKGELVERPISTSLYKTFMVGHFWHAYIQKFVVEKLGFAEQSAIERKGCKVLDPCGDGPTAYNWVTGSGDIAPCTIPGHGDYLVDIKTMNGFDFGKSYLPERYADKWECQVNVYMDFFDLEHALILSVQKDSPHEFKEFEFTRNQPLIDALYTKWKLVCQCLHNDVEPPADEDIELPLSGPIR